MVRPGYVLQIARFTLQEAISRRLILAGVVILPAALLGVRVRPSELMEAICCLALGLIALAEVAAVA